MTTTDLKSEMHQLIDALNNEEDLKDLYASLLVFAESRTLPKMGDASPERIAVLERALQQAAEGKTKTNAEFMQELKQWRTK